MKDVLIKMNKMKMTWRGEDLIISSVLIQRLCTVPVTYALDNDVHRTPRFKVTNQLPTCMCSMIYVMKSIETLRTGDILFVSVCVCSFAYLSRS